MNLNCLLVDDEPIALSILEEHIKSITVLNIVAKCFSAAEAFSILKKATVDVIFIDIQMPGLNGIDFIRSLKNAPNIILTTAHPKYALDGFDLDVVDYLLKPISFERLLKAVDKIYKRIPQNFQPNESTAKDDFFFVKSNHDLVRIEYRKIFFVEALENYVKIHCEEKNVIVFNTMKNMEELLISHQFLRIHRSYIVNIANVQVLQNEFIQIGNKELPIGYSYKKNVAEAFKKYFLE